MGLQLLVGARDVAEWRAFAHHIGAVNAGAGAVSLGDAAITVRATMPGPGSAPAPAPMRQDQRLGPRLLIVLGDGAWFDAARQTLQAAGVKLSAVKETPTARGMYARDPDGATVELATLRDGAPGGRLRVELALAARDPHAAGERYTKALGATPEPPTTDATCTLRLAGARLHLFRAAPDAEGPSEDLAQRLGVQVLALPAGALDEHAWPPAGFQAIDRSAPGYDALAGDADGLVVGWRRGVAGAP